MSKKKNDLPNDINIMENYIILPLSKLVKAEWNYKTDDLEQKEKLKANITRNGQIVNSIVREFEDGTYEVIDGNHRLDAFSELNIKNVICFNKGKISKEEAMRIAIEINETKFEADNLKLAANIEQLVKEYGVDDLAMTMPYSAEEIENMSKLLHFDWSQYDNKDGEGSGEETQKFDIKLSVSKFVYDNWLEWKARCMTKNINQDERIFELAIVEALNIPIESLK